MVSQPAQNTASSTTAAVSHGTCVSCGGAIYAGLVHHCTTSAGSFKPMPDPYVPGRAARVKEALAEIRRITTYLDAGDDYDQSRAYREVEEAVALLNRALGRYPI